MAYTFSHRVSGKLLVPAAQSPPAPLLHKGGLTQKLLPDTIQPNTQARYLAGG